MSDLMVKDISGRYRKATRTEVLDQAATYGRQEMVGKLMDKPSIVGPYVRQLIGAYEHECFLVLMLNNRNHLISVENMFRGTVDGASIYPREVVKLVLERNATKVILAHNHPSGHLEASAADESITRRLSAALALIDVTVLDHLIVTTTAHLSFVEHGLI